MRIRAYLRLARYLRAARVLILDGRRELILLARDLGLRRRLYLIRLERLEARRLYRVIELVLYRVYLLNVFLRGRSISSVHVRANGTTFLRLLLRRVCREYVRLAFRRRREMALLLNDLSMEMLLLLVIDVRVCRVTVLVHLIILSRHLMLLMDRMLTLGVLRRYRILNAVMRIFL